MTEIVDLTFLDDLYNQRETWGLGQLSKICKQYNYIAPEGTLKRAAKYLGLSGVSVYIGGKEGKSYIKEDAIKLITYVITTPIKQRRHDFFISDTERYNSSNESRRNTLLTKWNLKNELNPSLVSLKNELHITKRNLIKLCNELNISVDNNCISSSDAQILKAHVNNLIKAVPNVSRYFAAQTNLDRYGKYNYMQSHLGQSNVSNTRFKNKQIEKLKIEKELEIQLLDPIEAQRFINKNNSTLIAGMKLLNLPIYKIKGTYFYELNDLITLNEFFCAKYGLKGQLARAFEQKLRNANFEFVCEKTFPNLKMKSPLRFDYYLPKYNCVIEIQGGQHFKPTTFGEDITEEQMLKNFEQLQIRDQLKRTYCIDNQIFYIEICNKEEFIKFDKFIETFNNKGI